MTGLALLTIVAAAQNATPDPLLLPFGIPGKIRVEVGQLVETSTGKVVTMDQIVLAAMDKKFVLLGESHDNADHHTFQANVIKALATAGRIVSVGMEMFTRPVQNRLFSWTMGWQSEEEFIEKSDWKKQWGFDFGLYRPIFTVAKEFKLPLVALNVPRDWVRSVGRTGPGALTSEQQKEVPQIFLGNTEHRAVFSALMGGHAPTGGGGDNIYAAQVLWDEGMADTGLKYMRQHLQTPLNIMAIVVGSGHVIYGQGIGYRIKRHSDAKVLNIVCIEADGSREISRGLGDFVYVTKPAKRD